MPRQRKIIVYVATSADGYIARLDGNVDWLNRPRPAGEYGMGAFYEPVAVKSFQRVRLRGLKPAT